MLSQVKLTKGNLIVGMAARVLNDVINHVTMRGGMRATRQELTKAMGLEPIARIVVHLINSQLAADVITVESITIIVLLAQKATSLLAQIGHVVQPEKLTKVV